MRVMMASLNSISISSFSFSTANAIPSILGSSLSFSARKRLPISATSIKLERKGKKKNWHKMAYTSLFGVGATEALAIGIGVLSFFVFAPKPLAQLALNLGKTLKPTIKELQDVSRELKSTLEQEIGMDDISSPSQNIYSSNRTNTPSIVNTKDSKTTGYPNGASPRKEAYTTEE